MNDVKWEKLRRAAECGPQDRVSTAMIVDSPWIPGYAGISTLDFYTDQSVFLNAYQRVKDDFPDLILLPDYWVEFGMAAESSGLGCKLNFYADQPVMTSHLGSNVQDLAKLPVPDPYRDGIMPLVLNYYSHVKHAVHERGEKIRIVASRGPLNIASQIMGISEFLMATVDEPECVCSLLANTTALVNRWLKAQADVLDYVEGIMVLDDIVGFFSEEMYLQFAHPYLKEIFSSFDVPVKIFHNDTFNTASYSHIPDLGVNIFNFSHMTPIDEVRTLIGSGVCLMGNVPPLSELVQGTPSTVEAATLECLQRAERKEGLLLSTGGGAPPGMPGENLRAMLRAVSKWNSEV